MILITGATGNFGKAAVEALLKKGIDKNNIAALARDATKAEQLEELGIQIRIGNYNNYLSLLDAFKGVEQLLFVSSSEMENRAEQQKIVIDAAIVAGITNIVYTSVDRKSDADNSPLSFVLSSHIATEAAIKSSGIDYTILRNNLYLDMLPWFLGDKVLDNGIFLPAGEGKIGFVLRSEMAEIAANILTEQGHKNKEYKISGTQLLTFEEIAAILSIISGKRVNYQNPDLQTYVATLTGMGVPESYAIMFGSFAEAARQGELSSEQSDVVKLLGREPMSIEDFLFSTYVEKTQ